MADYTRFKLRGDVKADWLNANPVLALNEPALETDTKRFKIGDGVSTYSALPYGRNTNEYASLYNVSMLFPLPSGFYTHATAIAAIPTAERIKGLIISYETASGVWYTEQYIGSDVSGWATLANWSKVPGASDFAEMEDEIALVRSDLSDTIEFCKNKNDITRFSQAWFSTCTENANTAETVFCPILSTKNNIIGVNYKATIGSTTDIYIVDIILKTKTLLYSNVNNTLITQLIFDKIIDLKENEYIGIANDLYFRQNFGDCYQFDGTNVSIVLLQMALEIIVYNGVDKHIKKQNRIEKLIFGNDNLFDKASISDNKYDNNGVLADSNVFFTSGFISINRNIQHVSNYTFDFISYYNETNEFISSNVGSGQNSFLSVDGATKVRLSFSKITTNIDDLKIEEGKSSTTYTAFENETEIVAMSGYSANPKTLKEVEDKTYNTSSKNIGRYIDSNTLFASDILGYATASDICEYDGTITSVSLKVLNSGTYQFAVGQIDQHDLIIISKEISIDIPNIGFNNVSANISILKGQRLFVKCNTSIYFDVYSEQSGFFYVSYSAALPFSKLYGVFSFSYSIDYNYSPFAFNSELNAVRIDVDYLKNKEYELTSQNGSIYKLIVSDAGVLSTELIEPINKILTLGNSITKHPITSFWWGEWGMAATIESNDYSHVLQSLVSNKFNNSPTLRVENISAFETSHSPSFDFSVFDSFFAGDEDLVVIRIGENVIDLTNYQSDFENLIDYVKGKAPSSEIIVTGNFWTNDTKDAIQLAAANSKDVKYCSLSQLDNAANKSSIGAQVYGADNEWHTVNNEGVASHPSDVGMRNIANIIFNAI